MTNHRKIVVVSVLRRCSGDKRIRGLAAANGFYQRQTERANQIRRSEERKGLLTYQQEQRGKANPSPGWAAVATTRRGKRGGADGDEEEEGVDESGRGRVGRVGRRRRRGIPSLPPPTKAVGPGAHEPYTWSPTRMGGGGDGGVDRGSRRGWAGRCCFTFTVYAQSSCFA